MRIALDKRNMPKIVDLETFCQILFEKQQEQRIARIILEKTAKNGKAFLVKNPEGNKSIMDIVKEEISPTISPNIVSRVWKTLRQSGLLYKPKKSAPVKLSKHFSKLLRQVADYWEDYVESKSK